MNQKNNQTNKGVIAVVAIVCFAFLIGIISNSYLNSRPSSSSSGSYSSGTSSSSTSSGSSSGSFYSNGSSKSSSFGSSSTKKTSGCQFKYSNGERCGRPVGSHSPLCDYHFNQLNDTYNSITGGR